MEILALMGMIPPIVFSLPVLFQSMLCFTFTPPPSSTMDSLGAIEAEYIKNLQKQVCLLECETSYLRERAKKATSVQPQVAREAEKILQKIKELETAINTAQIETVQKENSTKIVEAEIRAIYRRLQILSDANAKEKLALIEDATKLKQLADISTQNVSHKAEELLKIQRNIQLTAKSVKEKEHKAHLLESQLQLQIQQHQATEQKLTESRSECLQLQALLHQLEEKLLIGSQSVQQHIAKELSEESEKLRQVLKEKELSADEDKYLRDKMSEDCGHLTRENGLLQAQVLKATRQLSRVLHLQQERKSMDQKGQLLQSQLIDLEKRRGKIQLENSKLQREKTHLVEHIAHLHKEIAEKEKEFSFLHSHVNSLSCDLNSLQSQVDTASILQKEKWKEFSNILTANRASMS
uniref:kinesin-like protein KIF20B isoform X3 n=1 Tax=Podarcis muralis TaxID=64176 RepID=UPI00109FD6D3|nr:kinesin-like protein KIF20B isoform X3 [Podarcis muralis]